MKIEIQSLLDGARGARGHVVLIDVFTTTTLIATLLDRGAKHVRPALSIREAWALGRNDGGSVLMGERWGKKVPGFDHNTSAVRAGDLDVAGRPVILSTTNGTLGILSAHKAEHLFLGCFRNLAALAERLAAASEVTLVPIGIAHGRVRAIEDELCAEAIRRRLAGEEVGFGELEEQIRRDPSSRMRNIGRRSDVDFCLDLDAVRTVPEMRGDVIVASRPE